jgi:hypothetical protein
MPLHFTVEKEEMLVDQLNEIEPYVIEMVNEVKRRYGEDGRDFIMEHCQDPVIRMWMLAIY